MRLFLAPMEGVVDHHFRDIVTPFAGVDICVTEFVRVTSLNVPARVFFRYCPELENRSRTASGTPVRIQLLGGNVEAMAESARIAAGLGAAGIDINFGCPSKKVNRNDGGSVLLKEPERIESIVTAVRMAVPDDVPVSAKIRLGFSERKGYLETARAVANGGATELFVHARSKTDGYRPPAYWECIAEIREAIHLPVIANGEIWNLDDWQRCKELSGADDFMLGRGLISTPDLAAQIRAAYEGTEYRALEWQSLLPMVYELYTQTRESYDKRYLGGRVKQWLAYLQRGYHEAEGVFAQVRKCRVHAEFEAAFEKAFSKV